MGIGQELTMSIMHNWEIICLFFVVALLYSTVGFGGGSSYLALLILFAFPYYQIRTIAVICNIAVVSGAVYLYTKNKLIPWKKVIPLITMSIPMAFIGAKLKIENEFIQVILGTTLLFAATLMWNTQKIQASKLDNYYKSSLTTNIIIGGFIGFVSGILGIGGGIFLAPFLYLSNWGRPKIIAATCSLFILSNSISGLIGQIQNPNFFINYNLTLILVLVVLIGGQIGSRLVINLITPHQLKRATSILIAFVAIKNLWSFIMI